MSLVSESRAQESRDSQCRMTTRHRTRSRGRQAA
jgi:hypothetical protein